MAPPTKVKREREEERGDDDRPPAKHFWYVSDTDNIHTNLTSATSHNYNDLITVLADRHEQPFKIHRELICSKSTYFQSVCSPENIRTEGGRYPNLPEVEATTFQAYVEWVYTSKVAIKINMADKVAETGAKHKALFALYNLGEELGDVKLRNQVMDCLVTRIRGWPSAQIVARAWDKSLQGSCLRKMIVSKVVNRVSLKWFLRDVVEYPADLVREVAIAFKIKSQYVDREGFVDSLPDFFEAE